MSLDAFVQLVFNVYEAYTVALFVSEEDHLSCFAAISFAKSFDKARTVSIEGTLPGWVAKHREALIIGNFDKDEESLGYYGREEEIKSFMAYPLEMPGVIVVDSKKKWVFTDKEKKILSHFVSVLSKEVETEKQLREMEDEREGLSLTKRVIAIFRAPRDDTSAIEEVLKEGLSVAGADLAFAGAESKGRIRMINAVGAGSTQLLATGSPSRESIVSTIVEGGREFLLPYESGFLREKPLLFQTDGLKAKQFFGFPLMLDERPFGFVGFASFSQRRLREEVIGVLRDISLLVALFLGRFKVREEMIADGDRDPVTGALSFGSFYAQIEGMTSHGKDFALFSVRLNSFKTYNRSQGVGRADDMLRRAHQAIAYCMGKTAIITRSGGGHFYGAVRGADVSENENILNILRFTVLGNMAEAPPGATTGIELGIAFFPRDGEDVWTLMDVAMDRGKRSVA
jgi:GGDEF domain-containing protein